MSADSDTAEWRYAAVVDADRFVDECDYDEATERMVECESCGSPGEREFMRGDAEDGWICYPCDRRENA